MDQSSLPPAFEQTSVYHLASTWLNPREDPQVLAWLLPLTDLDPEHRRLAVNQMKPHWREASVRVPLLVALSDPDVRVRGAAADAMWYVRDARAVDPLLAFPRNADRSALSSVVLTLGALQDPRAVEPLLAVLQAEIARQAARGGPVFLDGDLEMIVSAWRGWGTCGRWIRSSLPCKPSIGHSGVSSRRRWVSWAMCALSSRCWLLCKRP